MKKSVNELESEIRVEAELTIKEKIYGRRALIIFVIFTLIMIIAALKNNGQQATIESDKRAWLLIIYGIFYVVVITVNIPLRLAKLLPLNYNKKMGILINNTFAQMVGDRIELCPIEIKEKEKSIEEAKHILRELKMQYEEDIQSDEIAIEALENEAKLLDIIKKSK